LENHLLKKKSPKERNLVKKYF
jgi:hypothetical protein